MLLALAGTVALVMVVVTSMRAARRRLRYESWHLIHLYAYLGVGPGAAAPAVDRQDFIASPVATVFWWSLYAAALAASSSAGSACRSTAACGTRLVVTDVRSRERRRHHRDRRRAGDLHRLPVRAGQFFHWRFLGGPGWSRAHPYSLSAAPDGRSLRITVAHLGDGSAASPTLRPGTRVLVEGPYGRLHAGVRTRAKVLLMALGHRHHPDARPAGGARAGSPATSCSIYRARSDDDVHPARRARRARRRPGAPAPVHRHGSRVPDRRELAARRTPPTSATSQALRQLVPDIDRPRRLPLRQPAAG